MSEVKGKLKATFVTLIALLLMTITLSGCGKNNEIVATYDGGQVTQEEFNSYIGAMLFFNPMSMDIVEDAEFQEAALKQHIAIKLLTAQADEDMWKIQRKVANEEFALIKEQFLSGYGSKNEWNAMLKELNTNEKDLKVYLENTKVAGELLDAPISDAEIEAEFERLKTEHVFDKIVMSHILIDVNENNERTLDDARIIAEEIVAKLEQGEDFSTLAAEYSDDLTTAEEGGTLPEMNGGQLVSIFGQAVLELAVGQVSEPIAMTYGYHIVRIDSREVQQFTEIDEEMRGQIRGSIINTRFIDFIETELPNKNMQINL